MDCNVSSNKTMIWFSHKGRFLEKNGNNNTRHTHNVLQCPCHVVIPTSLLLDLKCNGYGRFPLRLRPRPTPREDLLEDGVDDCRAAGHHVRAWSRLRFLCENPQPNINPLSTQLEIHTFLSYFWQGEREKRDGGEGAPTRQHRHLEGQKRVRD